MHLSTSKQAKSSMDNHNHGPSVGEKRKFPTRRGTPPSSQNVKHLFQKADDLISSTEDLLRQAKNLCSSMGESLESPLQAMQDGLSATAASTTTGGHSNTDHFVVFTNDIETDHLEEFKRNFIVQKRKQKPESKGEDRWDKPRIPGERRRRILREKDGPGAPPEPPSTGYIIFIGQMTAKIRHDRPHVPHSQTAVVQELSKMWRITLSEEEREHYVQFADQARAEYNYMQLEFRATGAYRPSRKFIKLEGTGPWIHMEESDRNGLERELASYDTVQFPPRPPDLDEAYQLREMESIRRRKLKLKGLLNPDGTERTTRDPSLVRAPTLRKLKTKDFHRGLQAQHGENASSEPTAAGSYIRNDIRVKNPPGVATKTSLTPIDPPKESKSASDSDEDYVEEENDDEDDDSDE